MRQGRTAPGRGALRRRAALRLAALATPGLGMLGLGTARAQGGDWPNRPVRYVNPYPPSGPTDTLSRLWCARMSEVTGQQFVVENRSGSGGNVGADVIAKSAPDGYTVGLGGIASHAIAPTLYASLPFDPHKDFTLVGGLWQLPNLLAVNLDLPARTVPELIALLKAHPGRYTFGSAGAGTTLHLAGEMFGQMAGVQMVHVPYRGSAPAQLDLVAGRIQMMFDNIPGTLQLSREGRVRPLAVTSLKRSPVAPEIPALSEFLPGFDIVSWTCLSAPAGLPPAMVARMSALSRKALESEALVKAYRDLGAEPWWTSTEDIASYRAAQEARLAPLIRASGARVD
ncbi:Bug family tripartite tricarboxylate transporter substrate binding protein [Roseicella frigidaeris]|uniref:Tripartite tricarboxylate transporter substrate binding protein n=1 Tax=Roseicella frigidaeris TaxID=2230885 RepID=A0A327MEX6_9PROT|nr:tripartite tricarboxylate transporter substrate binding protein [Roseicella frigidaeris]RAI60613.1 tripartite tricarboxylate transporter substrate binding protein [Roseicella frigidaeris]